MAERLAPGPLVLLDGMSLAFRAFFALSTDIATSDGLVTNALHGFASMLHSLIRSQNPRALAVAFDLPGGTFRDAMTTEYKGGRAETPVEIEHQFDLIRSLCENLNIPVLSKPQFEADDVLATVATWGRDAEIPVVVVTGDRDCFQLVQDPFVRVLYNRRGVSDYSLYDETGIFERCGVEPARYPLLAALRGDPSDNLPGVPGVGEKTAAKLLSTYPDFDQLFSHLSDLTPKLRENLALHEERARQNARVMTLVRDVPLDFDLESLTMGEWNRSNLAAFFERFEMNSMRSRFEKLMNDGLLGSSDDATRVIDTPHATTVSAAPSRAASLSEVVNDSRELTVLLSGKRVGVLNEERNCTAVGDLDEFLRLVGQRPISGHDVKGIFRAAFERGITLAEPADDTAIMAFLVDATSGRYDLVDVAQRFLGEVLHAAAPSLFDEDADADDDSLVVRVSVVSRLRQILRAEIERWELGLVYSTIELPLVAVLGRMEARGIRVDVQMLREITAEFTQEAQRLDAEIQQMAGHEFKVNSPQQLQTVLFSELGLTPGKKIKTGYSTDASTLESLAHQHGIVPLILRYREVEKLRSTYGATLIDAVRPDGRIHALFHQTVARTGRLSSENPNLHNIPVRSLEGRRLRFAFVPQEGWTLAVADYNQIELRILAHLSQDSGLLDAFESRQDVHRTIAGSVFGVEHDEVSHEQRELAKAVSYGLAYGMEAFGLSQRLAIPVGVAKDIMEKYFAGFPTLRQYMDDTVKEVRAQGYSRTEFGRIRPFPDLATAVGPQRAAAERQAMNAGIQGLAADIFKSALVRLDHRLSDEGLQARLVLQVHDEVLVEAPVEETARVQAVIVEALTEVAHLSVPLEVSLHWGQSWAEAKG